MSTDLDTADLTPIVVPDPPSLLLTVHQLLPIAAGKVGPIEKGATMGRGDSGYKYRTIEQITERAQGVFADLRLSIVPHRCVALDYVDVQNNNGTKGRHYLGKWLWRVYGPAGDFIELETPGECAEWGGDKGANKALTASRKNALTTALNLAENRADPDSYESQEAHAVRADDDVYVTQEIWAAWKDVRSALTEAHRATLRQFVADHGWDWSKPGTMTVAQGAAVEAKARELLEGQRREADASRARDADPNQDPPHPTEEEPQVLAEAPERIRQENAFGKDGMWRCTGSPSHDVKAKVGDRCPFPGCTGWVSSEEPF